MKRIILFIPFVFLFSCNKTNEALIGTWKLESVNDKNKKPLLPVSSGDYLELTKNGDFTTVLYDAELEATGTWESQKSELRFIQNLEDTAVAQTLFKYKIEVLEGSKMVLSKGDTIYTFKK